MTQRNLFGLSKEHYDKAKSEYEEHLKRNDPLISKETGVKKTKLTDNKVEEDFKNESDDLRKFLEDKNYILESPKLGFSNRDIDEMREIAKSLKDETTSINLIVEKIRLDN